jgi:hypothetical protein
MESQETYSILNLVVGRKILRPTTKLRLLYACLVADKLRPVPPLGDPSGAKCTQSGRENALTTK